MSRRHPVTVTAPPGGVKQLLAELLRLADSPHDLAYRGFGPEVAVTELLAERWRQANTPPPRRKPSRPARSAEPKDK